MKFLNKIIALILATVLMVGLIPFSSGVNAAENVTDEKVIIYASKVKKETSEFYRYDASKNELSLNVDVYMDFVVDQDISFNEINSFTNIPKGQNFYAKRLTIQGNKKLSAMNGFICVNKCTLSSGSNVFIGGNGFNVDGLTIESGATLTLDCKNLETYGCAIESFYSIYSAGNLIINSNACGIMSESSNVQISGGEVRIAAQEDAICAISDIYISSGRLYLSAKSYSDLNAWGNIIISGGYIDMNSSVDSMSDGFKCIKANKNIVIKDPMYIKMPTDGYVKRFSEDDTDYYANYDSIVDKDGKIAVKAIISCPEEDTQIAAEEAAAKKAAEEAAKKAAEEAAAKKAAEEAAKKAAEEAAKKNTKKYSNEWVDGKWYNADGTQTYEGVLQWKCNSTGWWVEDTSGWYPVSQWQKIDGKWYYFLDFGYMDYGEYRDGYWLGSDGALVDGYYGQWKSDSTGWWFEDTSGWYPQSQWLWINGKCYYFESDGYLATSKYVDGYWVGSDGACQ